MTVSCRRTFRKMFGPAGFAEYSKNLSWPLESADNTAVTHVSWVVSEDVDCAVRPDKDEAHYLLNIFSSGVMSRSCEVAA